MGKRVFSKMSEKNQEIICISMRRKFGINKDSKTVLKASIEQFCNNFIFVMESRMACQIKKNRVYIRSEEQLKAYRYMKRILTGK